MNSKISQSSNSLKEKIIKLLKDNFSKELFDENIINQTKLIDLICTFRENISSENEELKDNIFDIFLKDEEVRKSFFLEKNGFLVFKQEDFRFFIERNKIGENNYTKFENIIGLSDGKRYLKNNEEVVLNFPFKDCILEGGQSAEDVKRNEIFFNEVLAKNEIIELKKPKALQNCVKISSEGDFLKGFKVKEEKAKKIDHEKDNLLIKGNNLLALYSLLPIYKGKVKLIYIDPPYNTGNDGFKYNDNFNHSTWLTFMKNRLEVARELLSDDGVIFVQCDDNEQAYLKVLMDEVFCGNDPERKNFVASVVWLNKEGGGKSDSKFFRNKHEYILCFGKNTKNLTIKGLDVEDIDRYTLSDKYLQTRGKYQLVKLDSGSLGWVKSLDYPIELQGHIFYAGSDKEKYEDRKQGGASIKDWGWRWRWSEKKLKWGIENDFIEIKQNSKGEWNIYTKQYLNCDTSGNNIPRKNQPLSYFEISSTTQSNRHIKEIFGKVNFNYSKPEALLERIIQIATKEGDLVLDFFAGSGTTPAVAHKMKRRWIAIEQMDYIEDITKFRLQKVLEGEQGGASKNQNWQGGGEFFYLELAKWNEKAKEEILKCQNLEELKTFFLDMNVKYFLNYNLEVKNFLEGKGGENANGEEFKNLTLEKQQELFIKMLDLNQMYILASEVEDGIFKEELNKEDIDFTKLFYRK